MLSQQCVDYFSLLKAVGDVGLGAGNVARATTRAATLDGKADWGAASSQGSGTPTAAGIGRSTSERAHVWAGVVHRQGVGARERAAVLGMLEATWVQPLGRGVTRATPFRKKKPHRARGSQQRMGRYFRGRAGAVQGRHISRRGKVWTGQCKTRQSGAW